MRRIAEEGHCTGCAACVKVCPKQCIKFVNDELDAPYAVKDLSSCINCGLCEDVCPEVSPISLSGPSKCYAAYALNQEIRRSSASGGIAATIYEQELSADGYICGALMKNYYQATVTCTNQYEKIQNFQNSKYVFSEMGDVYTIIERILKDNKRVAFIGLPCQISGLKNYLRVKRINEENLFTADLICHGTAPNEYLKQHIDKILGKRVQNEKVAACFRDPEFGTEKYFFTLRKDNILIYKKSVYRNDYYQIGYHKGIIYRSNCYNCRYARKERPGDVTLGDFSGLGSVSSVSYSNDKISCVLVNTQKGEVLLDQLCSDEKIFLDRRPIEEATKVEKQLIHPTQICNERLIFQEKYEEQHDYEMAMKAAAGQYALKNELIHLVHIREIRAFVSRCLPDPIKSTIKKVLHR